MSSLINSSNSNVHLNKNQTLTPQQMMDKYGKTFALAAKLLTPDCRQDSAELYAFARTVDDLVDMQATNQLVKMQVLQLQKTIGNEQSALQSIMHKYAISPTVLNAFLQAQIDDEDGRQIATQQCLINYAYGVAGSIGEIMRPILGASHQGEIYAISLGIAMQLTNIARDLVEDASRERIYVPATFFSESVKPQTIQNPGKQETLVIFMAITQLINLATSYYDFAHSGYRFIPFRNRLSIAAAAAMYKAIGTKILKKGHVSYWQGRVSINKTQKIGIAFFAIIKTTFQLFLPAHLPPINATTISTSIAHAIAHYYHV